MATAAHASIIPTVQSVTPEGSLYRWSYQGTLAGDQGVIPGSRLIILDFAGFAGDIRTPSPFIIGSAELTSTFFPPDPTDPLPSPGFTDDPTLYNLVFTWAGPPFHATGGPYDQIDFNGLSALSRFNGMTTDGYTAIAVKNNGDQTVLTLSYNQGAVGVPIGPGVPEPATWGMMILGFGGIGTLLRSRRRLNAGAPA